MNNAMFPFLLEGLSHILYHSTSLFAMEEILNSNVFNLTTDMGTESEIESRNGGRSNYMSFSRSPMGEYRLPVGWQGCLLVLDGEKLGQRYRGKPVDYWGPEWKRQKNEMEDRLFSQDTEIPNAMIYIREIHMFLESEKGLRGASGGEKLFSRALVERLRRIRIMADKNQIPCFFYTDRDAFRLLDKRNTRKISDLPIEDISREKPYYRTSKNYFKEIMELLCVDDFSKLSYDARRKYERITHSWSRSEVITGIMADIHNDKKNTNRPNLVKFLKKLRELRINSVSELLTHIEKKFKSEK